MKKFNFLFLGVSLLLSNINIAQNPFASIGKQSKPMLSLSDGKYVEHFENDSVRQIGSAMVNVYTEQIVAFIGRKEQSSKIHSQTSSRFLSIDPLAKQFPYYTPYQYAGNKPVNSIDLDGLEEMFFMGAFAKNGGSTLFKLINQTKIYNENKKVYQSAQNPGRNLVFVEGNTTASYYTNSKGERLPRSANGNTWSFKNNELGTALMSENQQDALYNLFSGENGEQGKFNFIEKKNITPEFIANIKKTYDQGRDLDMAVINSGVVAKAEENTKFGYEKMENRTNAGQTTIHEFVSHVVQMVTGVGGHFDYFSARDKNGNISEKDNGQYEGVSKENYGENSKAQQAQTQLENAALKE